jgi:hypothetical protein
VQQRDRGVGDPRTLVARHLTGDHPQQRAAVRRAEQRHRPPADVLVARRRPLQPGREVDPQLEAVEQAAARHHLLGWRLDVEDSAAGSNPVNVASAMPSALMARMTLLGLFCQARATHTKGTCMRNIPNRPVRSRLSSQRRCAMPMA